MDLEEILRLLQNLIRIGNITDVRHAYPARVRVASGKIETDWLPWVELRAGESKTWDPPTKGEQVVIFSPGGDLTAGFVLGGLNSDGNKPPSSSPDERVYRYRDGATETYNHKTGSLTISGMKTLLIQVADSMTVETKDITLDAEQTVATGKFTVEGLLSYLAGMSGKNGGGSSTTITGDINHSDGSITSNGVVLHLHIHSGVLRGDSNTEEPVK